MTTGTLAIAGAVLGLLIGSFVNVVAYRVPQGISVIRPPSACPHCGHEIAARDNIPVFGWLLVRGRCRSCAAPVSIRYPLVEALTAGLFVAVPLVVGAVWVVPAYWWFAGVTLVLALTDLDHKRIPNRILYPGLAVGLVLLAAGTAIDGSLDALWRGLGGGAGYFGLLLIVALLARGGFGFGDVKLAALLGLFTAHRSWDALGVAIFGGFLVGGLVGVALLIARRVGRKETIPFGPAMIVGAYVGLVWGAEIVDWYLG